MAYDLLPLLPEYQIWQTIFIAESKINLLAVVVCKTA